MLKIKDLVLGDHKVKICVPIAKSDKISILNMAKRLNITKIDLVELRLDYYEDVTDLQKTLLMLKELREILHKILLVTFRTNTNNQGGKTEISFEYYKKLYGEIINNKLAEIIDLEYNIDRAITDDLKVLAKDNDIKTIYSYHNFSNTPDYDILKDYFDGMSERGADIVKIAVISNSVQDVELIKKATIYSSLLRPTVGISMGKLGEETRINAKDIGCCFTFAAFDGESAPGQVSIDLIKR